MKNASYAHFDGMAWPLPDCDVEWFLRYGEPTRQQMLHAASIVAAYNELIGCPETKRRKVIRQVRAAVSARE